MYGVAADDQFHLVGDSIKMIQKYRYISFLKGVCF